MSYRGRARGFQTSTPASGSANPYAGLAAGAWQELTGTTIRSVVPGSGWTGNPTAITDAWSGGCVDTLRHRLLVWGGGHTDYDGNEVYAINFSATPGVARIFGPTGGSPVSMHTYGGMAYMSHVDKMFEVGGAVAPSGSKDNTVWELNLTSNTFASHGTATITGVTLGTWCAYDPVTERVYVNDRNSIFTFQESSGTWTNRGGSADSGSLNVTACIDSTRRRFVCIDSGALTYMHLDTFSTGSISTSNTPGTVGENNPGLVYDPVGDRFVLWAGGTAVYAVAAAGGAWADIRTSDGPSSLQASTGTYGRWGYDPAYKVCVLCNSIDENLFVFKLASGS